MRYKKLSELRGYVQYNSVPQRWIDMLSVIIDERKAILDALRSNINSAGVYGFTSMLGPNDHKDMLSEQQNIMLSGHYVGIPTELSEIESRAILASKIIQLSNGGTGISGSRYKDLLDISKVSCPKVEIDLDASYGSGDVVPAAWWVRSLWAEDTCWNPGDLISLINGDFISTAFSYLVFEKLLRNFASFVNLTCGLYKQFIPGVPANYLDVVINSLYETHDGWDSPPQLAVSQRDVFPILHSVTSNLYSFADALEIAYSAHSGNPIFIRDGEKILAKSQSSFLNLELSGSLQGVNSLIAQMSASVQRATEIICSENLNPGDNFTASALRLVQFPKVSEAYKLQISLPLPLNYSGSMSGGVEDFWDLNLINSREILRKLAIFEKQLQLLEESIYSSGRKISHKINEEEIWSEMLRVQNR